MKAIAYNLVLSLCLAACANPNKPKIFEGTIGNTPYVAATADLRFVFARPKPANAASGVVTAGTQGEYFDWAGDPNYTLCAEPSPDVAKALSDAITASSNATANGLKVLGGTGAEASLDAFLSTARAGSIGELGRRLPTTQLLRDGVYRLCEAYANGAITREEYALVLSRYGETMVTLLAIESLTGMSRDLRPMTIAAQATPLAAPVQQPAKPNADANKSGSQGAIDDAAPTVTRGVPPLPDTKSDTGLQKISLTMPRAMVKTARGDADPANPPNKPGPQAEAANGASGVKTTDADTDLSKVADTVLKLQENYLKHSATAPLIVLCSEAIGPRMLGGETLKNNCEQILGIWLHAEAAKLPALQTPTIGADANAAVAPHPKPGRGK